MSFQKELEDDVAAKLEGLGFGLIKGIIRQVNVDTDPELGDVIHGEAVTPFASVSSIIPERLREDISTGSIASVERQVTVAIIANKVDVEGNLEAYREYRQAAIREMNLGRLRGAFDSDPESGVLMNFARPRRPHETAAWQSRGKWISAFDVLIHTREKGAT